ncbi:hypothetical protein [Dawidia soli]|uniref:DUF3192 domain-containing protein n=1 Tax=Dawidia soli TaxID=2782352 RepID=A0AAP2DCH6_9BACT|nr:hypothetical protein [Dawidia soli]MBT1688285.1 DUF3192 domain-containing protein [Dawidia soli]
MKRFYVWVFIITIVGWGMSCHGDRIDRNVRNSQKLKVGMTQEEALAIMGEPDYIREHANEKGVYDYYYESPFGASDLIFFTVDPAKRVIEVTPYPELPYAFESAAHPLGSGYTIDFSDVYSGEKALSDSANNVIIKGPVLDYVFDSLYIVVAERPFDSIPACAAPGKTFEIKCREAFDKSTFSQYWIVYKKDRKVNGPLSERNFQAVKDTLEVASNLKY